MKISKQTMDVLKNFAVVHESLIVREPNSIVTMSRARNVVAVFDTEEEFPVFGVYNLQEFLGAVSLFDLAETEFDFKEKWVNIKYRGSRVRYTYTNIDHIENSERIKPSEKYKAFDKFNCRFSLAESDISRLKKASAIMFGSSDSTNVHVFSDGESGFVKLDVEDDPMSNAFKINVTEPDGECKINFNVSNLLLHGGDYEVAVLDGKLIQFKHASLPLWYFISPKVM